MDLRKQQPLDADPKAMQQINFTKSLYRGENVNANTTIDNTKIIEDANKSILDFLQGTVKVL